MSHKEVWNMVLESRLIFPVEHPLHNLDIMVLGTFLIICTLMWVAALEWKFVRWEKKQIHNYEVWEKQWKQSQEKLNNKRK